MDSQWALPRALLPRALSQAPSLTTAMLRSLKTPVGLRALYAPGIYCLPLKRTFSPSPARFNRFHSTEKSASAQAPEPIKIDKPTYQLTFTCKVCSDRGSHLVSKQAYHHGTVLIQCPSCKNRHLIADNLNVFQDGSQSLEDILAAKGEKITKASLDGDLQWEPELAQGAPLELKDKS